MKIKEVRSPIVGRRVLMDFRHDRLTDAEIEEYVAAILSYTPDELECFENWLGVRHFYVKEE